jgi:ubiquinone/menaquinone biosynthesis C-methylase UbiE
MTTDLKRNAYDPRAYWPARLKKEGALYVSTRNSKTVNDAQWKVFRDCLRQAMEGTSPGRILDFGCGVGRFAETAMEFASSYVGVDINYGAFEHAPTLPNVEFVGLPEDRIPFEDNTFDSAMSLTVLQHIVDPQHYATWSSEIARVVKPGGLIYIIDDADQSEKIKTSKHMKIRGPQVISESMGSVIEEDFGIISAERKNSHYLFRARRV